ncbi:MFS transporter [Neobacillus drentensis]|uniref:MFS transporter n=1 Tax=Neobacillus drentensis TaxID=220684 RepID=UPI00285D883E|nr:MFS transporter [Neobacillus drentensis]MDR7236406.1 MFS family permease [Neobacillus drentensis]
MEKRRFWNYENKLVALFFFSIGFVFFDRLAINYLVPFIQKDFSLTNTQIGLLGSALAITWTLSGPLGGYLSDRAKSKKVILAIFVLGFSLISLLHGIVASFAMLFFCRLIMGLVEGPITPITQSVLAIESSEKRRGFNVGLTMNTGNAVFGSFLAPLVIVALANAFDWRTAFYLTIIPGIILAIFILKVMKNPKVSEEAVISPAASADKVSFKDVIKHRNIWLSIIMFSFFMTYVMAFNIFGPNFLVNAKGFSESTMSLIMAAFGAGFAILGVLVPAISDRVGRKPITIIFGAFSIFTPLAVYYVDSVALMIPLVFLFSSGMGAGALYMSVIPAESVPVRYAGVAVGLVIGFGEFFGGFINPILSGMAADAFGLGAPLFISAGGAALAFFFSLFLKETAPVKVVMNQKINNVITEL